MRAVDASATAPPLFIGRREYGAIDKHGGANHQRCNQPADDARQHPEKQPHPVGFSQTPDFEQKNQHKLPGICCGHANKASSLSRWIFASSNNPIKLYQRGGRKKPPISIFIIARNEERCLRARPKTSPAGQVKSSARQAFSHFDKVPWLGQSCCSNVCISKPDYRLHAHF